MKIYRNKNEYIADEKRYIEDIMSVNIEMKCAEKYNIDCSIHQRGYKAYTYTKGNGYIEKADNSGKKLWLEILALQKIEEAIAVFDEAVDEAINGGGYTEVRVEGLDGFIYYRRVTRGVPFSRRIFNVVMLFPDESGEMVKLFFENCHVSDMIWNIEKYGRSLGNKTKEAGKALDYIFNSDNKTIAFNPLYLSAVKENDKMMQCELKLHYGIADEDECRYISENTGLRILPLLPKEYDKSYVVVNESENIEFLRLLRRSGYMIIHVPYFSMKGKTHYKYELNPHNKSGLDAADKDAEAISADDFLALFDEYEKANRNKQVN